MPLPAGQQSIQQVDIIRMHCHRYSAAVQYEVQDYLVQMMMATADATQCASQCNADATAAVDGRQPELLREHQVTAVRVG